MEYGIEIDKKNKYYVGQILVIKNKNMSDDEIIIKYVDDIEDAILYKHIINGKEKMLKHTNSRILDILYEEPENKDIGDEK
jgi:hypothetical protein